MKDQQSEFYYDVGGFSVHNVLMAKVNHVKDSIWAVYFFKIGKYALRWPFKHYTDPRRDIQKIINYSNALLTHLDKELG